MKRICLLLMVVLVVFSQFVFAGELKPDLSKIVEITPVNEKIPVIILFHERPTPADISIIKSDGASIKYQYTIINAVAAQVPAQAADKIAKRAFVRLVEPDYKVKLVLDKSVPQIQADKVWEAGTTGKNIDIAIIDTGIHDEHPALTVEKEIDYTGEGTGDLHGHGTHVAGIIASKDSTYRGVAHDSDLFNVKVLNKDGSGYGSDVIEGIEWSVDNGAEIINISLGAEIDPCDGTDAISQAVDKAVSKGVVVVVAAGNSGPDSETITSPGCSKKGITIGAVDGSDNVPSWSSRGPTDDGRVKPDLIAPGVLITSTWKDNSFNSLSGTSMATPHVVGTVALLLEADSSLKPSDILQVLKATSVDLGFEENTQGAGRVDALAAFSSIETVTEESTIISVSLSVPESVAEKDSFYVTATVNNEGNASALGVSVEIVVSDGLEVQGRETRSLGSIEPGLNKEITWVVKAIRAGNHTIVVRASADNAALSEVSALIRVETRELVEPGITPDSWIYGFKRFFEGVDMFFTFDDIAKAEKHGRYAELRLSEAKEMAEGNKPEFVGSLVKEYEENVETANEIADKAKEVGRDLTGIDNIVILATSLHVSVLEEIYEKVPEQARPAVSRAKSASLRGYDKTLGRLGESEPEKAAKLSLEFAEKQLLKAQEMVEEEREGNAESLVGEYEKYTEKSSEMARKAQQVGRDIAGVSELIATATSKQLEVLEEVYDRVPEQAKLAIERAKSASTKGNIEALDLLEEAEPERASELHFRFGEKRLARALEKAKSKEIGEVEGLIEEYKERINNSNEIAKKAQEIGEDVTKLSELVGLATTVHSRVLDEVYDRVPEKAREAIVRAKEASAAGQKRALRALSGDNPIKATNINLDAIKGRLNRAKEKAGEGEAKGVEEALEEYEEMVELSRELAEKYMEVSEKVASSFVEQLEELDDIEDRVPEEAKERVREKKSFSLDKQRETLRSLARIKPEIATEINSKATEGRLNRAKEKAEEDEIEGVEEEIEEFKKFAEFGDEISQIAQGLGKDTTTVEELVAKATSHYLEVLNEVYDKVPEQAKESIERAMSVSVSGREKAVEALKEKGALGEIPEEIPVMEEIEEKIPAIAKEKVPIPEQIPAEEVEEIGEEEIEVETPETPEPVPEQPEAAGAPETVEGGRP